MRCWKALGSGVRGVLGVVGLTGSGSLKRLESGSKADNPSIFTEDCSRHEVLILKINHKTQVMLTEI